jgi:uncharacterized protein
MDPGITVTGTGQASAPADLLHVVLSVGCEATDVAAAVEAVAERTVAVTAALRELGVAAGDVQTTGGNVFPNYGESMRVHGYRASHSLTVSTADLDGFGRLLTAAIDAAGNDLSVEQLSFDVADKAPLLARARQSAFEDARAKAEHLAVLTGRRLGTLESVEESAQQGPIVPLFGARRGGAAPDLAVTPGEQTVELAVTVRWAWESP